MIGEAFCPAHLTGFFTIRKNNNVQETGSLGAGFSIRLGVNTSVEIEFDATPGMQIKVLGYTSSDTRVSEQIVSEYRKKFRMGFLRIRHAIKVPVGYGFGCSAAVALSLSMALNAALGSPLTKKEEAGIAHKVEIECRTGLGDVLAAYHGGFEMRYKAGAPGIGMIEKIKEDPNIVIACFAPMSTRKFISEKMDSINGLGGKMLERLAVSKDHVIDFQDMSLEFAKHVGIVTPNIKKTTDALHKAGIKCGVALFGETIFAMVDSETEKSAISILENFKECQIIKSRIDTNGARLQTIAPVISSV